MGAYFRQQRKLADLSMRQVSTMAGISNPYLSQIERGLRAPSEAVAAGIAAALGISVDEFYARYGTKGERSDLLEAITNATELTSAQQASLAEIYRSFVHANAGDEQPREAAEDKDGDPATEGAAPQTPPPDEAPGSRHD